MGCAKTKAVELERCRKISEAMKASYNANNGQRRKKLAKAVAEVWKNKAEKKRRVKAMVATKFLHRAVIQEMMDTPEYRKSLSDGQKRRWSDADTRKRQSRALKDAWIDDRKGRNLRDGLYKNRPRWRKYMTKPEQLVYKLLKQMGYSYRWTGGGQGRVERFVPDFMHRRFKRIVEVYGNYWHGEHNRLKDASRIRTLKREGYKVLVIRQPELKNEGRLMGKIKRFHAHI